MYGGTFGSIENEENFLEDVQMANQGVMLLNPDALQSQFIQDYMDVEDTDELEILENLKDTEFLKKYAQINQDLQSFGFPNMKRGKGLVSKMKYLKLLEKAIPKFDGKMHQLILKTPDPAE